MVEGFDGFPERDMLAKLCEGTMTLNDTRKGKLNYSCEGLYTRSGFVTPGNQFWIHSDYDRQKGKDGSIGGYVAFVRPADSGLHREDRLVPKYGYIAAPDKADPISYGYRKHNPIAADNVHVSMALQFKYRYVSASHLVKYLAAMKAQFGADDRVDFNTWLGQACGKEFAIAPGFKVRALYRGVIDARSLAQFSVNFADGNFKEVSTSIALYLACFIALSCVLVHMFSILAFCALQGTQALQNNCFFCTYCGISPDRP